MQKHGPILNVLHRPTTHGTVVYSLEGYETRRLEWPSDIENQNSCTCRLKDVALRRKQLSSRVVSPGDLEPEPVAS
jgi:hypothetical protein